MQLVKCEHGLDVWPPTKPFPKAATGKLIPFCYLCWRAGVPVQKASKPAEPQRGKCFHLGVRTEFRDGCSGWMCEHECDAGQPVAVPGGVCQSCNYWESR